ncbi:TPM domain-containing protein [Chitinibacter bivalviorum]|uniref:TPM domain-containing protein n=1 Tax=Chitinibacter bivalviorum TaxID=2739434 RepID=A0A7H9BM07_9NEIS|nr:TPM domain-containing protein [Chitinibacter bivalviorum]QLG89643.1 TPM domain-containing protein [Chitinibacter bivalviorum]
MKSTWARYWQHLKPNRDRALFGPAVAAQLTRAITASEYGHRGEIRLVVESHLLPSQLWHGISARERAISWFSDLRVWDTEGNTGIMLYLLLAENKLELVADRGIAGKVPQAQWDEICQRLQTDLAARQVEAGLSRTLHELGALLAEHFPLKEGQANPNELCNDPVLVL